MSDLSHKLFFVLFGILLIIGIVASIHQRNKDYKVIEEWALEQDYIVDSIEQTFFDNGPFWLRDEDDRFYKVKIITENKNKTYYFRFKWYGSEEHKEY